MATMTEADICRQCKQKGFYRTPELNEQLYLHFAGYCKIENLSAFTACRVLWLEHNLIDCIEGLENLPELRVVHLEHNRLRDLGQCSLPRVETLNAAHNFIEDLSGLACFTGLQRLYLSNNDIHDDELRHLQHVPYLAALDLGKNRLSDPNALLAALARLPKLKSLILSGNDVIRQMPGYRKVIISAVPSLMHLDDMPVFPMERRTAEAWARGGRAAEVQEAARIKQEDEDRRTSQRAFFENMVAEAKAAASSAPRVESTYARTMRLLAEEEEARARQSRGAGNVASTKPGGSEDDEDDIVVGASATHAAASSPTRSVPLPSAKAAARKPVYVDPCSFAADMEPELPRPSDAPTAATPPPLASDTTEEAVLSALRLSPTCTAALGDALRAAQQDGVLTTTTTTTTASSSLAVVETVAVAARLVAHDDAVSLPANSAQDATSAPPDESAGVSDRETVATAVDEAAVSTDEPAVVAAFADAAVEAAVGSGDDATSAGVDVQL